MGYSTFRLNEKLLTAKLWLNEKLNWCPKAYAAREASKERLNKKVKK